MSNTKPQTKQQNVEERKQGFLSMLAMIVGVVIASGIFFKNDSIMEASNSAIASMTAWIVVSIIVLLMMVSFMEVASSTSKKKEPGSYGRWTSMFVHPKVGKLVDYFFVFVYLPTVYILLALVASEFLMDGIFSSMNLNATTAKTAQYAFLKYFLIVGTGIFIICILFTVNNISTKSGKFIQIGGTTLKIIPLITISLIAIVAISGGAQSGDWSLDSDAKNEGLKDGGFSTLFVAVFAAIPSVMYAFDGFAHSAALQNEAKSKSIYKLSLFIAIIFIVFIYLFSSWAMLAGGDEINGYSASSVVKNMLGSRWSWLAITITFLISISVITGLSGFIIVGNRTFANLSEENWLADVKGKYLRRNKNGIPIKAGQMMMFFTTLWFFYLIPMDMGSLIEEINATPQGEIIDIGSTLYVSSEYMADLVTVVAFVIYASISTGALFNRWRKKVDVDKSKGFIPATIVAAIALIIISGYMVVFDIFIPLAKNLSDLDTITISKFIMFILVIGITWISYLAINKRLKTISPKEWKEKQVHINAYKEMMTPEEYQQLLREKPTIEK